MTKKYLTRLLQASLMCCLAVFFTACDDMFATEDNPTSAYLGMSEKPVTIKVGETFQRQAIATSTAVIEYTSSDTKVATVDNTGLVTAIAEGETTITATATGYSSQTGKKIYQPDSKSYKLTVESAGPAATITTAPVATAATISAGSATALVTAGVADGGTMMYRVTPANEAKPTSTDGFSADIPSASNRAAGTYSVWYYAKGDATHSNSKIAGPVEVTLIDGYAANEYNYASWNYGDKKVIFTKKTAASVTAVTNSDADVTWGAGWYTVSGNVTINGKVTLSANTSLILQDGATLTINGQLNAGNNDLFIYGQMEGTGKLNVTCNDNAIKGPSGMTIKIYGGEITATATGDSHYGLYFGYIEMYSGKLTATAADYHAIKFESWGFRVYGGEVEATSNATSGDYNGIQSGGTLMVYGGKVKGTGSAPNGIGFDCKVQSATSNIKFYFSDNGTTWGSGLSYGITSTALGNRYAKAE